MLCYVQGAGENWDHAGYDEQNSSRGGRGGRGGRGYVSAQQSGSFGPALLLTCSLTRTSRFVCSGRGGGRGADVDFESSSNRGGKRGGRGGGGEGKRGGRKGEGISTATHSGCVVLSL